MSRRVLRRFTAPVTAFLVSLTSLVAVAPGEAIADCYGGTPFVGIGAGIMVDDSSEDGYWGYHATGRTTFSVVGNGVGFDVRHRCGTFVCMARPTCTTNVTGPLLIHVYWTRSAPTAYVLTAVSEPAPSATCEEFNAGGACVNLATGAVVEQQAVYGVTTTPVATHTVGGWVDAYRFALPTGGSAVVPCVVLTVNSAGANPCATAGGTFISRAATLVTQSVNQPAPAQGAVLATVRICEATVTATVGGYGIENIPLYALC